MATRVNAQGRRVTISALAASLASGARGSDGLAGIFVAEHNGAQIIAASFKGAMARKAQRRKQAASATISSRIRGRQARKEYQELRNAVMVVQRYAHGWLARAGTKRIVARKNWVARMVHMADAFIEACHDHDVERLKELCTDNVVVHVDLAGGLRSFHASGISAVANRVRQHNINAVISPPYMQHEEHYDYASNLGACVVAREVLVGREPVHEEFEVKPTALGVEKIIRHLHAFTSAERDLAAEGGEADPEAADSAAGGGQGAAAQTSSSLEEGSPPRSGYKVPSALRRELSLGRDEQPPQSPPPQQQHQHQHHHHHHHHHHQHEIGGRRSPPRARAPPGLSKGAISQASAKDLGRLAKRAAGHADALGQRLKAEQTGDSLETLAELQRRRERMAEEVLGGGRPLGIGIGKRGSESLAPARSSVATRLPPLLSSPDGAGAGAGTLAGTMFAEAGARQSPALPQLSSGMPVSVSMPTLPSGRAARPGAAVLGAGRRAPAALHPRATITMQQLLAERGLTLMSGALSPTRRSKTALTRHLHRLEYGKRIETSGRWIGMEPTFRQKYSSTSRALEVPELLRAKTAGASAMQRGAAAAEMMSRYP